MNKCCIPLCRKEKLTTHLQLLQKTQKYEGICDVLFIGDSIIEHLQHSSIYSERFPKDKNILNFGIGGDRVEHVLWRINDGKWMENLKPKIVVIFVGTNNVNNLPVEIFDGIKNLIDVTREMCHEAHIIVPLLHPKGKYPNKYRNLVTDVNNLLRSCFQGNSAICIVETEESKLIGKDCIISSEIMYDYLHLTDKGYTIAWTPVINKVLQLLQ